MTFNELHKNSYPLILCNVWDANSARIAEKLGFQAIGTSSAAIACMLGYEDGEKMQFKELCYVIQRIAYNTSLPLSVDMEAGYSRIPTEIVNNIKELATYGIAGINLEDSIVNEERILVDGKSFANIIHEVKSRLNEANLNIFLNIRTDTYLLNVPNKLDETQKRIELYTKAGADGIFIPCLVHESDIKFLVDKSRLPINVMAMPDLPGFEKLKELGVKRISMGDCLFSNISTILKHKLGKVMGNQSFDDIFSADSKS
ncbi:carboxyvinyl-carboxyphosphonate phosphorylmutase [Snodgrassella alvi]|uniref:Carboxyvinyl-carboxyphosphonate phosphorylmutase n=1 Tax=Snodgrassella alvi TaxID=1196083 RepID=A0A2N9WWF1_9NEIS|nr:isocitrate lyase/phosphoenolpyruvate mutase family protein [Snodgrassella alvi]PIT18306.1 carboxyvinyl-carboxyphosphonate phosphorylmutase [Snodgrassella alvi]